MRSFKWGTVIACTLSWEILPDYYFFPLVLKLLNFTNILPSQQCLAEVCYYFQDHNECFLGFHSFNISMLQVPALTLPRSSEGSETSSVNADSPQKADAVSLSEEFKAVTQTC